MRTRFDQLAKSILDQALASAGEVRTQEEIAGEVQAADVWFRPAPGNQAARARLGLLGRMVERSCLIEPFHDTPGVEAVLDCVSKQLTLRRKLAREARKGNHSAEVPHLWLISVGRPNSVLTGLRCEPLAEWPTGVWHGPPLLGTFVVVLRDLPETRDTLPLRLLGAGPGFARAAKELYDLPRDAWEHEVFIPLLLAYRVEIFQNSEQATEDDMRYAEQLRSIYDDWERRVFEQGAEKGLEKGLEQGLEQGMRELLVGTYEARFGTMGEELRAALDATADVATLRRWGALFATAAEREIAAAVLTATRP
jgi:hypothetical protein